MRKSRCLVAAMVVGLAASVAYVRADEEKVPLDKLPEAVTAAVKKRFDGAELIAASKEVEGGKTTYEVTLRHDGHKIDVDVTPEGSITGMEKEIAAKDLPKGVSETLDKSYAGATLQRIEEIIKVQDGKDSVANYEILLETSAKKRLEVVIKPDGKVAKEEDKTKKKD